MVIVNIFDSQQFRFVGSWNRFVFVERLTDWDVSLSRPLIEPPFAVRTSNLRECDRPRYQVQIWFVRTLGQILLRHASDPQFYLGLGPIVPFKFVFIDSGTDPIWLSVLAFR